MLPSGRASIATPRFAAAFSLIEIAIAMVVVGLIVALVLPALTQVKNQSHATRCIDNSRLVGAAFTEYADNNKGRFVPYRQEQPAPEGAVVDGPEYTYWPDLLSEYAGSHDIWHCPECQQGEHHGFGIGYSQLMDADAIEAPVRGVDDLANPSQTVAFGDTDVIANPGDEPDEWVAELGGQAESRLQFEIPGSKTWDDPKSSPQRIWNRHLGRANVVFADQHAESVKVGRLGFQKDAKAEQRLWDRD